MSDGSAVFYHRTLCIWSILLGSAVLFPSYSDHGVNAISSPVAAMFFCVYPSLSSACVRVVNVLLSFLSDTVYRYSAILYSLFRAK